MHFDKLPQNFFDCFYFINSHIFQVSPEVNQSAKRSKNRSSGTRKKIRRLTKFSFAGGTTWTPHTVELAVWTHSICYDLSPELLEDMPEANAKPAGAVNPAAAAASSEAEVEEDKPSNNGQIANDEDTKSSMASSTMDEDSQQGSNTKTEEETTSEIPPPASEVQPPSEAPEAVAKEEPVAEVQPLSTSEKEEKSTTNGNTPKTNGNNSHNGSEVPKNGEEAEAKDNNSKAEDQPKNGELENGVVSHKTLLFETLE